MWMRKIVTVGALGAVIAATAGCTAGHDPMKVIYQVSGGEAAGTIALEYVGAAGMTKDTISAGTVNWSEEVTLGENVDTAAISAHSLAPGLDTKLTLTCVIFVGGKEVARKDGFQSCQLTVQLDDL
ncbi:hypothetical protein GCM10009682_43630 [Luedemannella flava]|uniref:Uncharacterized protein n=1 Tax=Luedemannella flava TaxID=349316 RepID=A0ABP4YHZ5_9ACTN